MAETTHAPAATSGGSTPTTSRTGASTPGKALETTRGSTTIVDSVVTKVAGIAAREVAGVYALGGSSARAIGSVTQRVGIDTRSQGVSVEVEGTEAKIDVTVVIEYGESIPKITQDIRDQVIRRVEAIVGLTTTEVNISVNDLHFAGDDEDEGQQA